MVDRNKQALEAKQEEMRLRRIFDGFTDIGSMQNYYKEINALRGLKLTIKLDKKAIVNKMVQIKDKIIEEKDESQLDNKKPIWKLKNDIELLRNREQDILNQIKCHEAQIKYFENLRKIVKEGD